jgi:cytochrome b561
MMQARYARSVRILHWLLAALLLLQLAFGWWVGELPRNTPERGYFINLHKSIGIVTGLLILLRIYWRLASTTPTLSISMARWQQRLATASHQLMYLCMLVLPLSGYIASNFSRFGVKFFNAITLAPWGPNDKGIYTFFNQLHSLSGWLLLALVALHVLAAIGHGLRRDGIFFRIALWPL